MDPMGCLVMISRSTAGSVDVCVGCISSVMTALLLWVVIVFGGCDLVATSFLDTLLVFENDVVDVDDATTGSASNTDSSDKFIDCSCPFTMTVRYSILSNSARVLVSTLTIGW